MPPKKISLLGGKVVCVGTVLEPPKGGDGTAAGYLITAIRAFVLAPLSLDFDFCTCRHLRPENAL